MNKLILLGLATLIFCVNTQALAQEQTLPTWLKNTAVLWGQNEASDKEFFDLLQYLVDADIITTPQSGTSDNFRETVESQSSRALTYMIADIPSEFEKQDIYDGIYDGLNSWAEINSQFTFREITVGEPDIMITWTPYNDADGFVSYGCNDCLQKDAFIKLVLEFDDCNGNKVQLGKEYHRNNVAHTFGLIIGLDHHNDINHLMYSSNASIKPYDDQGYNIPARIESFVIGEKLYVEKLDKIKEEYNTLIDQQIIIEAQYNMSLIQYEDILEQYENNRLSKNVLNIVYDNLEIERKKLNDHIKVTNRVGIDYDHILDAIFCINGVPMPFSDDFSN